MKVARPGALIVAKAHKLYERLDTPKRLNDKDDHGVYRLLQATGTAELAASVRALVEDPVSRDETLEALGYIREHLAVGPAGTFAVMAGRAESGLGEPDTVALSASLLARDLLDASNL